MIDCSQLSLGDTAIGTNSAVTGFVHFRHTESESPRSSDVVPASIPFQTVLQAAQIVRLSRAGANNGRFGLLFAVHLSFATSLIADITTPVAV
jgi:hypothetical protein